MDAPRQKPAIIIREVGNGGSFRRAR